MTAATRRTPRVRKASSPRRRRTESTAGAIDWTAEIRKAERETRTNKNLVDAGETFASQRRGGPEKASSNRRNKRD